jgi:hypothetical protein
VKFVLPQNQLSQKKRVELYPFGWLFAFEEAKAGLEAQPNMA